MNYEDIKNKYNLSKAEQEKKDAENEMIQQNMGKGGKKNMNKLSIELNRKTKIYNLVAEIFNKINAHEQTLTILEEENDKEILEIAKQEKEELEEEIAKLEEEIIQENYAHLLEDPDDERSIILEMRAGAGGDEASLFVNDLFRMYTQYANSANWKVDIIDRTDNSGGGSAEIIAHVTGKNVFKKLKYESGVHRVQRIPATESSGRIHTSTISVAVLPEAKEIDISINPEDIRIDVMRSSGAGGQSVNKTDSAVRITHLPTSIIVTCQDTKYQQQNKDKAMAILRSRLYDREKAIEQKKRSSLRSSQIGSAMRAEKIRTYNYPQNRVTDHRIKKSWYNLEDILNGYIEDVLEEINTEMINLQIEEFKKDERVASS